MKRSLLIMGSVLLVVVFFAGLSTGDVQAKSGLSPAKVCQYVINLYDSWGVLLPGSRWDAAREKCILGWDAGEGTRNACYPGLDIYQVWEKPSPSIQADGSQNSISWGIKLESCFHVGTYILEAEKGESNLGGGVSFEYEIKPAQMAAR